MSKASEQTQFKQGNQAWKARSIDGRKPIFNDPDVLHSACLQYFQWVEDNPLMTTELVKYQGEATQVQVPRIRAMTIAGLCIYLDISPSTWAGYSDRPDFLKVTELVESIIYCQKFEGAAADLFNGNIIARELGLADRQEVKNAAALTILRKNHSHVAINLPDNNRDDSLEVAGDLLYSRDNAQREH